jgi:hypothetical protein
MEPTTRAAYAKVVAVTAILGTVFGSRVVGDAVRADL